MTRQYVVVYRGADSWETDNRVFMSFDDAVIAKKQYGDQSVIYPLNIYKQVGYANLASSKAIFSRSAEERRKEEIDDCLADLDAEL